MHQPYTFCTSHPAPSLVPEVQNSEPTFNASEFNCITVYCEKINKNYELTFALDILTPQLN